MMDRRTALKFVAAVALAGCESRERDAKGLRVVVAGAGIVGASIAWHLARSGASVTVIDAEGPASHATRGSFAWINATWAKQPRHYHSLSQTGVSSWHDLEAELGIPIQWGGSFEWFDTAERQAWLAEQVAEQADWGEPARMLAPDEFQALEPRVDFGSAGSVAWSGNDGAVDPILATRSLLQAAERLGATTRFPALLQDVVMERGVLRAVETSGGRIAADRLVLATGAAADAGERFGLTPIPQRSTPGIIAITKPFERLVNRVVAGPGAHIHQRPDGRIVIGEQDGPPETAAHAARLGARPNDFPTRALALEHAQRMISAGARLLPELAETEVEHVYIGWRPLPLDGHPVIGAAPERAHVYTAIMHSGVTLAPVVGQLAAHELVTGTAIERLDAYRPGRTFERIKRY